MSDTAPFVFYELKKRDQSIVAEILCRKCFDARPEGAHPLTDREIAAGYRYTVRPYTGDHECMQCEARPSDVDQNSHAYVMERDQSAVRRG